MTKDIYEKHQAAFKNVSAFVICDKSGERVATIAFKHGNAVTCFLHIIGLEMTQGRAGGGGYDRKSASAWDAVQKTGSYLAPGIAEDGEVRKYMLKLHDLRDKFKAALHEGNGSGSWDRCLRDAGFIIHSAV